MAKRTPSPPRIAKPVIFLSHSSKDAAVLRRLKTALTEKTHGSLEIFLSSDGQSVPLGRNWVHSIEEALTSSALMLVCVSQAALQSQWIFFESGFAYSRNVQVVPIGLPGVDLSHLPPPLSLLQGFNINSHQGLNNLLALINRSFGTSHPEGFTEVDFNAVFGPSGKGQASPLGTYADLVDRWIFDAHHVQDRLTIERISELLESLGVSWQRDDEILRTFGMAFALGEISGRRVLRIAISPTTAATGIAVADDLLRQLDWDRRVGFISSIRFAPDVCFVDDREKTSAAFLGTGVQLTPEGKYAIGDLGFEVETIESPKGYADHDVMPFLAERRSVYLHLAYTGDSLRSLNLTDLITLLYDNRVLTVANHSRPATV